jgi:hypothetical protein
MELRNPLSGCTMRGCGRDWKTRARSAIRDARRSWHEMNFFLQCFLSATTSAARTCRKLHDCGVFARNCGTARGDFLIALEPNITRSFGNLRYPVDRDGWVHTGTCRQQPCPQTPMASGANARIRDARLKWPAGAHVRTRAGDRSRGGRRWCGSPGDVYGCADCEDRVVVFAARSWSSSGSAGV